MPLMLINLRWLLHCVYYLPSLALLWDCLASGVAFSSVYSADQCNPTLCSPESSFL